MDKTDHAVCVVSMACGVNWLLEAYTVQCPVASEHLLVARCMPGTSDAVVACDLQGSMDVLPV